MKPVPDHLQSDLKHAIRLEWWTLAWQTSIVVVMYFVLGSSQAMKSAWMEDLLGLVPAGIFLLSVHFERQPPTPKFPFGFLRVNSLAFLASASVLVFMGAYLLYDSVSKLIAMEHPTLGPITLFGETIWIGWVMMAALAYSVIPPVIIGRLKQPVSKRLRDKVLHTDALMQKADWMTGLAGILGVSGVGFGFWWADSVAAALIALDIAHDGLRAARVAIAELSDGMPRELGGTKIDKDAKALKSVLEKRHPGSEVRLRETGRFIAAQVTGPHLPDEPAPLEDLWTGDPAYSWRLANVSYAPKRD
ncbi:cation diffusion facilitator family transporter [Rhizobium sp. L1K21]|uniref:cation diffusion facilitator family transporter n=1 Tax=Rhizobium sp. L1K21 TaxID=2954933 RepID=UPI002093F7BA|nr:cation diffusion facilitator family transporter [Rhizobium sp. L1K21]MCO6187849.1 cation diffusion facilitator family transporter [Rhizobium sp. L1K21]